MALADTARLIASLELQDKFTGPAKRAEGSLTGLDRKMSTLSASGQRLGAGLSRAFATIAKIGIGVAAGGIAALAVNVRAGIGALNELQNVTVATDTVLKSTDGVAGQTAKGIRELAEEYESLNATIDDKVIQNAENLLLTFTNVRSKAFEPALEAALNLNEAMGGGEAGLQSNIIRVGKALQDPTKGIAALARAGVQFSKGQQERIKQLQEEGKLYEAQQIILGELSTQFGGRFAAAGKTAEGQMARLGDTVEDLQKNLAGPLIPAIDRVRGKLIDFLGSKQARNAATELGEAIAGIFTNENINKGVGFLEDALQTVRRAIKGDGDGGGFEKITANIGTIAGTVAGLPWAAIGDAARLLGTGSKALLDAFLGLPPWVQTAVLTGWGLNKLTGGALGGIVGELAKGLIKGILGISAGVVNVSGRVVNGPGGGVPPGGGGLGGDVGKLVGLLGGVFAVVAGAEIGANLAGGTGPVEAFLTPDKKNPVTDPTVFKSTEAIREASKTHAKSLAEDIHDLDDQIREASRTATADRTGARQAIVAKLQEQRAELIAQRNAVVAQGGITRGAIDRSAAVARAGFADNGAKIGGVSGAVERARGVLERSDAKLAAIERKKTQFEAHVTVNTDTSINVISSATQTALQIARVISSSTTDWRTDLVPTLG
jgi:ElaB/YqjD/DUF883 family membrane-anchored ribosome-binding protein